MTNEEAKKRLEVWLKCVYCPEEKKCYDSHLHTTCEYTDYCDSVSIEEAIKVAIKDLEQEPCEDCISRKKVNILVDELARAISDERCCMPRGRSTGAIMQDILDLPPVTLKTGHWIEHEHNGIVHIECSKCSTWFLRCHLLRNSYCPNCGAKMVELQEGSEKE